MFCHICFVIYNCSCVRLYDLFKLFNNRNKLMMCLEWQWAVVQLAWGSRHRVLPSSPSLHCWSGTCQACPLSGPLHTQSCNFWNKIFRRNTFLTYSAVIVLVFSLTASHYHVYSNCLVKTNLALATCDKRTHLTGAGLDSRCFTATGPCLWNNLPLCLCDCKLSIVDLSQLSKTNLFSWRSRHLVTVFP